MSDDDHLEKVKSLALHLTEIVAEFAELERRQHEPDPNGETSVRSVFNEELVNSWPGITSVIKAVNALDSALHVVGFGADDPPDVSASEFFSLGSITFYDRPRLIHAGFIQPVIRLPIVRSIPDRVVAYFLKIPAGDEWIERENHSNMGYHYHYLNAEQARSDIALCWDIRAAPATPHPLFQEKHGESHSKFPGRPDLWGETKRLSFHKACAQDLQRWPLDKFRMACDKAGPVWPVDAVLTARPSKPLLPPRFPSKRSR